MKKPTVKQMEILKLMSQGYELGVSNGWFASVTLQKGGLGRGGDCIYPKRGHASVYSLFHEGYIESAGRKYPDEVYRLTEKGRQAVKE